MSNIICTYHTTHRYGVSKLKHSPDHIKALFHFAVFYVYSPQKARLTLPDVAWSYLAK